MEKEKREEKSFYIRSGKQCVAKNAIRALTYSWNKNRKNKEVLKINRNFSLAFTWDPIMPQQR